MSKITLREPMRLGPVVTELHLVAIEIDAIEKRIFLRYTVPENDGTTRRGAPHEQMEILTDAILPVEPPRDPNPDDDARAQTIYLNALTKAQAQQNYTSFLTSTVPLLERAAQYFTRQRALTRA